MGKVCRVTGSGRSRATCGLNSPFRFALDASCLASYLLFVFQHRKDSQKHLSSGLLMCCQVEAGTSRSFVAKVMFVAKAGTTTV